MLHVATAQALGGGVGMGEQDMSLYPPSVTFLSPREALILDEGKVLCRK